MRLVQGIFGGAVGVVRDTCFCAFPTSCLRSVPRIDPRHHWCVRLRSQSPNARRHQCWSSVCGLGLFLVCLDLLLLATRLIPRGFGGVLGPIFGGVFESPGANFKDSFLGHIGLFQKFPYLLPTLIAGFILFLGSFLACFLSWDGGVRGGSRIALPVEKNEPLAPEPLPSPAPSQRTAVPTLRTRRSFLSPAPEPEVGTVHNRRDSRASLGTAYG